MNRLMYEKNLVDDYEKKIDRLENSFEKRIEDTRISGNRRLSEIKDLNHKRKIKEANEAEYKLNEIKQNLEKTEEKLSAFGLTLDGVRDFIENGEASSESLNQIRRDLESRGMAEYLRVDLGIVRQRGNGPGKIARQLLGPVHPQQD